MKKILLTFIIVITLGGVIFLFTKSKSQAPSPLIKKDPEVMKEKEKVMRGQDRYIHYSDLRFDESMKTRRVLFFYANWCPTCKAADNNFEQNRANIPEDSMLLRVNYNDTDTDQEEKDLAKKYGITYQHTFVQIDKNGMELTKWNGGQIEELLSNIK